MDPHNLIPRILPPETAFLMENSSTEFKELGGSLGSASKQNPQTDIEFDINDGTSSIVKRQKAIKYYKLARFIATTFSKDSSSKVGAVFLHPKTLHVLSIGYNGFPRGVDETKQERWQRPLKYKFAEHGERNGIYNAAYSGTPLANSMCIVSLFPCSDCARGLIQCGCKLVISEDYNEYENSQNADERDRYSRWMPDWKVSLEMFNEVGIVVILLKRDELA